MSNLSLYSNNSDSSLARADDLINITLEVSEQIYNATLQILGTEMDMTESNNTAYANITVRLFPARSKARNVELDLAIRVACIYHHTCVCYLACDVHCICGI